LRTVADDLVERVAAAATRGRESSDALAVRPLAGGMNNTVYVVSSDGERYCAKVFRGDRRRWAPREWWALNHLGRMCPGIAPAPIGCEEAADGVVVVMEFIAGRPLDGVAATLRDIESVAIRLKELYALPATGSPGDPGLALGSPDKVVARLRDDWPGLKQAPEGDIQCAAQTLWKTWLGGPDPDKVTAPARLVFCRGDGNLRNWLRAGNQLRLIDFEYSGWTVREFDLADMIEHVAGRGIGEDAWQVLLDSLGLDAAARAVVAAGRRTYAIFWLMKLWSAPAELADQVDHTVRVFAGDAAA
jgi:hypothetical protein